MKKYKFKGIKNFYHEEQQEDREAEFQTIIYADNIKEAVWLFENLFDEDRFDLILENGTKTNEDEYLEVEE